MHNNSNNQHSHYMLSTMVSTLYIFIYSSQELYEVSNIIVSIL